MVLQDSVFPIRPSKVFNPLLLNDPYRGCAESCLNGQTHKEVTNSVSNFGGILFTPTEYTNEAGML